MTRLGWWWAHWRARHFLLNADVDYRRRPSPANADRLERARTHFTRVEAGRP